MVGVFEVSGVEFGYGAGPVLTDVSLVVKEGETVGLLGPNGAGKSTLVKLICGLMSPLSGMVRVLGADPCTVPAVRGSLGVMHQDAGTEPMLTGWDNLFITGRFFGMTRRQVLARVEELAAALGPFDFLDQPVLATSGGQVKRLQVVRTLLHRPKVLLLDEPTAGLDIQARHRFYAAVGELLETEGATVVWTSHHLEEIERNCDRVVMLSGGVVVADADVARLKAAGAAPETVVRVAAHDAMAYDGLFARLRLTRRSPSELAYPSEPDEQFFMSVLPRLHEAGLTPLSFERPTPTLEQVYLRLTAGGA